MGYVGKITVNPRIKQIVVIKEAFSWESVPQGMGMGCSSGT